MTARQQTYLVHDVEEHLIPSKVVAQTFRIKVAQPVSRSDDSERFPVVYVTDSDEYFGAFAALASSMQFYGETPRFVLVGIGYENPRAASLLRMRDFYPPQFRALMRDEIEKFACSPLGAGLADLKTVNQTTGAAEFLHFICDELMPFVTARYQVTAEDSTYFGYSSGGAFGLYSLFRKPGAFRRYVLGSPVSSFSGQHFGIELAEAFVRSGREAADMQVFLSAGELEELDAGLARFEILSGARRLAAYLKRELPHLNLTLRIFPGETHATAWIPAFVQGLKALLGPAHSVPYRPEHLR